MNKTDWTFIVPFTASVLMVASCILCAIFYNGNTERIVNERKCVAIEHVADKAAECFKSVFDNRVD